MTINFGNVSSDYAKYRDRLPEILFDHLAEKGVHLEGSRVIDIGSGTGIFSRDLALHGAHVTGIEPSQQLIDEAVKFDKLNSICSVKYVNGSAEDFVLENRFELITAVRAWHWFDRNRVIQNIKKHLEPQGLLIVINSIFIPDSNVAKTTFKVLRDNNIELKPAGSNAEVKERRSGFPVNWFDEWEGNSLKIIHEWQHDYMLQFTNEEWCGKIRSVSWMTNIDDLIRKKVTTELREELKHYEDRLNVPHRFSVVILRND
jgi:2-polyprenyl-3-methyl-5-hydroxy-6-metoxy-1,4-benzoquinol methylase